MSGFTHFDEKGNAVMVDVHEKADTYRVAVAQGTITVNREVFQAIKNHTAKKGDVLGIARIADQVPLTGATVVHPGGKPGHAVLIGNDGHTTSKQSKQSKRV